MEESPVATAATAGGATGNLRDAAILQLRGRGHTIGPHRRADRIGCGRVLAFDDGGVWTHQLSGLSDDDMRLQSCIVATPQAMRVPVGDCRAEMQTQADPQQPANACIVT